MEEKNDGQPFSESYLESAEYRERLMRKLNCLIAVLEVASAKVRRSLAGPAPDVERLTRIKKNLQDTLDVCIRARGALEKRGSLPAGLSKDLAKAVDPKLVDPTRLVEEADTVGSRVEMSSDAEHDKFRQLGRIGQDELRSVDLDDLGRQLLG